MKTILDFKKEFEKTKFVIEGGSCFECCDYEEMRTEIWQFIEKMYYEIMLKKPEVKVLQTKSGLTVTQTVTENGVSQIIEKKSPKNYENIR